MIDSDRAAATSDELRAHVRSLERQIVTLQYQQLAALAELDARNVPGELGLRGLPQLVQTELRRNPQAARATGQAVARFAERHTLTGETLPPACPITAGSLADGSIGLDHATAIADVLESLPATSRTEHQQEVESTLVGFALTTDPRTVRRLGQRIVDHLDPDGPSPEETRQQESRRRVALVGHGDSSGELNGYLTPACQAVWEAVLAPLAAQRPADALGPDDRTPAQRLHDAFEQAGRLLLASGRLPQHVGVASQLIVTIELSDLERRAGRATTHSGGTLSIAEALRLAADGGLIPAVLGETGAVLDYGRSRRLASPGQRRALFARDRGCTFPGCTRTAAESEIHHALDWAAGGRTDLGSLAIACGYHNNEAPKQGWTTVMLGGVPHWRPPVWRDPGQRPVRNYLHHPELLLPARR